MPLKHRIIQFLERRGIKVMTANHPYFHAIPKNLEPEFGPVHTACEKFTLTPISSQYGLWKAVEYVVRSNIPGDLVECGVYKGGSIMIMAYALEQFGDQARRLYLYDTFEGMTPPGPQDVDFVGRTPEEHLRTWSVSRMEDMARSEIDEVRQNVLSTGLPEDRFIFVKGKVEETIPATLPQGPIALLRLDTDWFESTWHELFHLFPRLSPGGVLIVDDYAMWRGSREATDKYIAQEGVKILLNRMDDIGAVIGVKPLS